MYHSGNPRYLRVFSFSVLLVKAIWKHKDLSFWLTNLFKLLPLQYIPSKFRYFFNLFCGVFQITNKSFKKTSELAGLGRLLSALSTSPQGWSSLPEPLSWARRAGRRRTCAAPAPGASSAAGRTPPCSARWRGSASGPARREHWRKAGGPGRAEIHGYTSEFQLQGFCVIRVDFTFSQGSNKLVSNNDHASFWIVVTVLQFFHSQELPQISQTHHT